MVTIFLFVLPIAAFVLYRKSASLDTDEKEAEEPDMGNRLIRLRRNIKILLAFTFINSVIAVPFYISSAIIYIYTNTAVTYTERSLEIIAPYISSEERLELRSHYRAVTDAASFYAFYDSIKEIAETKEIELPVFKIAR